MPLEDARQAILAGAGTQFDPDVVRAFNDCFEELVSLKRRIEQADSECQAPHAEKTHVREGALHALASTC
jgi:HD-GYP domain-containing protein (c-di-GMP phosphodiesterase class II)